MFDKVNMTITCTTETRERPVVQQSGRQAGVLRRPVAAAAAAQAVAVQDVLSGRRRRGSCCHAACRAYR